MATRVVGVILVSRHGQYILLCSSSKQLRFVEQMRVQHKSVKIKTGKLATPRKELLSGSRDDEKSGVSDICTKQSTPPYLGLHVVEASRHTVSLPVRNTGLSVVVLLTTNVIYPKSQKLLHSDVIAPAVQRASCEPSRQPPNYEAFGSQ
jgi:hypothetical protein